HAFYNFNTESRSLPALAVRADLALPVGALAGDVARVTLKVIATRSWGLTRAHLNAAWSLGSETGVTESALAPRWSGSVALDRTLFRSSVLLLLEGLAEQEVQGAPTMVLFGAGARWQVSPTVVLDAGLSRRLTSDGPDIGLTVGLSRVFGVGGLLPAGLRWVSHATQRAIDDPLRCARRDPRSDGAGGWAGPSRRAVLLPGPVQLAIPG